MRNNQMNLLLAVGAVVLLGTAVVTLRAAEQATQRAATSAVRGESAFAASPATPDANLHAVPPALAGTARQQTRASLGAPPAEIAGASAGIMVASPIGADSETATGAMSHAVATGGPTKQHPPASAPEESATIADDPTTAPDPSQSADNNVSFPTDI
jgi:hypothetical protein